MTSIPETGQFEFSRRELLRFAGAGLLITTTETAGQSQSRAGRGGARTVAARLHIAPDGRITVMTGKVEIGQGSRAELTQAAAEELRVAPDQVELVMADTGLTPDDGGTSGSRTTPSTVPAVRQGAAAAREILVSLARDRWGIAQAPLVISGGVIREPGGGRSLSYASLARTENLEQALEHALPAGVEVTPVSDWKLMGTSLPRPNGRDLVTGAHRYPSDIQRPAMLYGKVLRPPSHGATLTALDVSAAEKMPGVRVVRDGNYVACAAATSHQARRAVEVLEKTAVWKRPPQPSSKQLFEYLKDHAVSQSAGRRGPRVRARGSLEEGLRLARTTLEATYEVAYIQHAPMEPRAAVAEWKNDSLTVWTGTQQPMRVRRELAGAFGVSEELVRVIVPDTGGGFGGKHTGEAAVEAARLAKAAGQPVSLRWTREEEFTWAYFRPAALIEVRAGMDDGGRLGAWEFTNINSGASAIETPYQVPHTREQFQYCNSPLREGSYRVLAATANNFARESFMDELAEVAEQDPLDFRLRHLGNDRLQAVLEAAAQGFGWRARRRRRQPRRGIGLACGTEKGSFVAACVEVEVGDKTEAIRVLDVTQAFECGAIVNPDNLRAQVEGCIIMTLGATLFEEIAFEDGRILNDRFSRYRIPRFRDVPPINSIFLNRPDLPSAGAGETPMIAAPPAVANAVRDAVGARIRSLPVRV